MSELVSKWSSTDLWVHNRSNLNPELSGSSRVADIQSRAQDRGWTPSSSSEGTEEPPRTSHNYHNQHQTPKTGRVDKLLLAGGTSSVQARCPSPFADASSPTTDRRPDTSASPSAGTRNAVVVNGGKKPCRGDIDPTRSRLEFVPVAVNAGHKPSQSGTARLINNYRQQETASADFQLVRGGGGDEKCDAGGWGSNLNLSLDLQEAARRRVDLHGGDTDSGLDSEHRTCKS